MTNLFIASQLFNELDNNTTILTPNRRLSATLHKLFHEQQLSSQKTCWETPDILPIASWLTRLWQTYTSQQFTPQPLLLMPIHEQILWEKILLSAKESNLLLQVSETADIVKSAWGLLKQWQVDIAHPIFQSAEDYVALHQWILAFQAQCKKNNWLDTQSLTDEIISLVEHRAINLPKRILLIGFTETSPQLKKLLAVISEAHCAVSFSELIQPHTSAHKISLNEAQDEILSMARWAKALHLANPTAKIGCVLPNLETIRDRVLQVFSEVFAPVNAFAINMQMSPFNISAGKSLSQYSLINTALQLLGLHKKTLSLETLSYLLASPFIGDAEVERMRRANFDRLLRKANVTTINVESILKDDTATTKIALTKQCPKLAQRLIDFFTLLNQQEIHQSYSAWAHVFNQLLSSCGWPGERSLSSEEYQIVESWLNLLNQFSSLDQINAPVNLQQALHTLNKVANKTIFQVKTPEAPIQILGVLEAAALPFDHLWVAGIDDMSWPPQPQPNPFIPKRLQRELHMPHATAERELLFCTTLIQQFKNSATQVIFSHACKNEELDLQASPLIRLLPEITLETLQLESYDSPAERIFQAQSLETLIDNLAPPLAPLEKVRGGVSVIKQQAACPFRAFAEWRLHAHPLESPSPGLRAKDRGTIIHKALELIWNQLQNQAALQAMAESDLTVLVDQCITTALIAAPNSRSNYTHYIALEKQRLHKLIWDWLEIEKNRPPFKVLHSETIIDFSIDKLTLSLRIDRIDQLADGRKLIIDYKTSKNNDINNWFDARPDEPQLPLYSLQDATDTVGISFAQIIPGNHGFKGISDQDIAIKGIRDISALKNITATSWNEQIAEWKVVLTKLSQDFLQGVANVDPKKPKQTCTWCALEPFCRINEEIKRHNEH